MAEPVREETDEGCGEPALDRIARVAARALRAPLALIALLDDEHRVRVECNGGEVDQVEAGDDLTVTGKLLLPANGSQRRSPLTVTASSAEPGASQHHLSYPLCTSDEKPVGVLCVADGEPREWTAEEHAVLRDLAALVTDEIELHRERAARQTLQSQLQRAEQLTGQFASALRHEFGQPLTVIQGFSELLSEGSLTPEEIREYALEINREAVHLSTIVSRIRDRPGGAPDPKVEKFAASRRPGQKGE